LHLDELTGLNNRRAFFELGNRAIKQAIRHKHAIAVIMMDLDHFKNINDNYGHSVGDKVLKNVAITLENTVREIDISARIGGEEFAFILPETDADEASQLAERLRSNIQNMSVEHDGKTLQITASFGISVSNTTEQTLESMLTQADDALYIAKKKGRNQVKICN
jgi:diguanylate cyclase (GGDEF)-like protein